MKIKKINLSTATREEKLVYFGGAKRVTAKEIFTVSDNNTLSAGWLARVRGFNIGERQESKEQALYYGRKILKKWQKEAFDAGLLGHGKG